MKKILVLGLNSYVGHYTCERLCADHSVVGVARSKTNWSPEIKGILGDSTDCNLVTKIIEDEKIDILINCVGMGIVDECENNHGEAVRLNFTHVKNLVELTNSKKVKLVHFSSNAVYSGDDPLYSESSPKEPKNFYGGTKAQADDFVLDHSNEFLLLRAMTLYGQKMPFHRNNPATMILHFLSQNKDMKLVDDLSGNLLFINDFVKIISILIERDEVGEFNVSGDDIVNRYQLGSIIKDNLENCISEITACSSDEFPSLAPRALNTSFSNEKIKALLDFNFTKIEDAVRETISMTFT